ncbi:MAG: hypothetical protein WCY05_03350 [Candidatus Omnitrophota bacterium]
MQIIFSIVYYFLLFLSMITGLTYKEINIITYYILIPFIFICLIDKIIKKHISKIAFILGLLVFCLTIKNPRIYAKWLFDQSVIFLQRFEKIGWNYIVASVIICVIIPGILLCLLIYYAYPAKMEKVTKLLNKKIF